MLLLFSEFNSRSQTSLRLLSLHHMEKKHNENTVGKTPYFKNIYNSSHLSCLSLQLFPCISLSLLYHSVHTNACVSRNNPYFELLYCVLGWLEGYATICKKREAWWTINPTKSWNSFCGLQHVMQKHLTSLFPPPRR